MTKRNTRITLTSIAGETVELVDLFEPAQRRGQKDKGADVFIMYVDGKAITFAAAELLKLREALSMRSFNVQAT